MSIIDLGETAGSLDDESDRGPVLRRQVREVGIAVLAALCLLTLTGSVRAEPRGVRPLWSVPALERDSTVLTRDTAYLLQAEAGTTRLTAYELAGGTVRWIRRLPGQVGWVQPVPDSGLLLVPTDRPTAGPGSPPASSTANTAIDPHTGAEVSPAPRETIALNARTGAELWRAPGDPDWISGGTALLAERTSEGAPIRLRLIRLGDQSTIWSRETPGVQNHVITRDGDQPTRIITADGTGQIKIFRYADGAYLTGARVPWVTPRPQDGYSNDIIVDRGFLVVNRIRQDIFDTTVYRLDSMAEAWSIKNTSGYAFPCGGPLCLTDGSAVSAHELDNGRRLWKLAGSGNPWPIVGDRMVLNNSSDSEPLLVDTRTGRPVGEPARGSTVVDSERPGSILLLRATTSPPNRTSITRWDLHTGRQHLLGAIDDMAGYGCQSAKRYLACVRNGRLDVMEIAG